MAPLTPQITLTATLSDQSGQPVKKGQIVITLCGYGLVLPKIAGTSMYARVGPVEYTLVDGTLGGSNTGIPLWGNDAITPTGTFYSIAVVDDKKNVVQCGLYQFTGSGTVDLSNAPQILPNPSGTVPQLQYATYDFFAISSTVTSPQSATPDHIADVMAWSVNRPVPPMSANAATLLAPPGYLYTLTRTPFANFIIGLFYNGILQLPSFHYQMFGNQINLQFYTKSGDNLHVIYVPSPVS